MYICLVYKCVYNERLKVVNPLMIYVLVYIIKIEEIVNTRKIPYHVV